MRVIANSTGRFKMIIFFLFLFKQPVRFLANCHNLTIEGALQINNNNYAKPKIYFRVFFTRSTEFSHYATWKFFTIKVSNFYLTVKINKYTVIVKIITTELQTVLSACYHWNVLRRNSTAFAIIDYLPVSVHSISLWNETSTNKAILDKMACHIINS